MPYKIGRDRHRRNRHKLLEAHADVDPLAVRFTDLHRSVMELDGFTGDPKESNEKN